LDTFHFYVAAFGKTSAVQGKRLSRYFPQRLMADVYWQLMKIE